MKKLLYPALIVVMIAVPYFYINSKYGIDEDFFKEMLEERIQENYNGIVIKKFIDKSGKYPSSKIILKSNTVAEPGKEFWKTISVGDSVVKAKGKDFATLYKKDTILRYSYADHINKMMKEELAN
ncbi:hypothetical protein [Flavobacterium sp. NRK1]|uniref:hypothetical protein n=1 Tax=Flavobacterium sp. NRK1 TaxID=2954929 RepID=UPI0020933192|nr:hypothetical protein [Flavobacterium sp. NRK1]MCO6147627.1 hypothetical protein [Flavobacterium sp. NRK1]